MATSTATICQPQPNVNQVRAPGTELPVPRLLRVIAAVSCGGTPIPLWVTDFSSNSTAIVDSGTVPVELQTINVE
jgi:hypothetical protein